MSRITDKFTYTDGKYHCNACDAPYEEETQAEACYESCKLAGVDFSEGVRGPVRKTDDTLITPRWTQQYTSESRMDPDIAAELDRNADAIIARLRRGEDVGLDTLIGFGSDYVIRRIASKFPDANIKLKPKQPTVYRVTHSPFKDDDPLPWDYLEDGFISWVGEVFCESYKASVNPIDTVEEALSIVRGAGYTVEVIE